MNIMHNAVQELAVNIPGATDLFNNYHIDFTAQQPLLLKDTEISGEITLFNLVEKLDSLLHEHAMSRHNQWQAVSKQELIAHILENYHAKHRVQLSEAICLSQKVANAHARHPDFPHELESHLAQMKFELEEHMMKEELILFPMLEKGMFPLGPISVMESEHIDHAKALELLRTITNEFSPPKDACNSWVTLYKDLLELYFDLKDHIHLENEILFQAEDQPAR